MSDAISALTSRMRFGAAAGSGGIAGGLGLDTGATVRVPVGGGHGANTTSFGDTLKQFVSGVSDTQDAAADLQGRFVRGEPVELHQVMAASEEANLSLEMMVELRNKVLDAYKTLVSMQS